MNKYRIIICLVSFITFVVTFCLIQVLRESFALPFMLILLMISFMIFLLYLPLPSQSNRRRKVIKIKDDYDWIRKDIEAFEKDREAIRSDWEKVLPKEYPKPPVPLPDLIHESSGPCNHTKTHRVGNDVICLSCKNVIARYES